jgi:hypothetical protein
LYQNMPRNDKTAAHLSAVYSVLNIPSATFLRAHTRSINVLFFYRLILQNGI